MRILLPFRFKRKPRKSLELKVKGMARPVKETPVLSGKDAKRFERQIKENEKRQVSEAEYRRAVSTFHSVSVKVVR